MTELHRLQLRYGEVLACELVAVVRDHHEHMPGAARDRPGLDRVRVRLPAERGGAEVVVDVWSRSGQDIARAPRAIALFDSGDLIGWRAADAATQAPEPVAARTADAPPAPREDGEPSPPQPSPTPRDARAA